MHAVKLRRFELSQMNINTFKYVEEFNVRKILS